MSQSDIEQSPKKGSKVKNFHVIQLDWAQQFVEQNISTSSLTQRMKADVKITVTSRRIKNQEASPHDILFRTHHYEFTMQPNDAFFEVCGGKDKRFIVELRLLKNMVHLKRKSSSQDSPQSQSFNESPRTPTPSPMSEPSPAIFDNPPDSPPNKKQKVDAHKIVPKAMRSYQMLQQQQSQKLVAPVSPKLNGITELQADGTLPKVSGAKLEFEDLLKSESDQYFILRTAENDEFREFVDNDVPVVTYSFTEDAMSGRWNLNLIWPTEKRPLSWRGKFCFHMSIFRRDGFHTYNHVMSKISSQFCIFSKPDVYLKKIRKSTTGQPKKETASPSPAKPRSGSVASKRAKSTSPVVDVPAADTEQKNTMLAPQAFLNMTRPLPLPSLATLSQAFMLQPTGVIDPSSIPLLTVTNITPPAEATQANNIVKSENNVSNAIKTEATN